MNNNYISSNMDELIIQLKERINASFEMVDKQFKEKINYGIYNLDKTFKILSFFLLGAGIKSKRQDQIKESEVVKSIEEEYNKFFNESLKEINTFFGGIILEFDNIYSENKSLDDIKKSYYYFKDKYNTQKLELELHIQQKFESFQKDLKVIIEKFKNELLFISQKEEKIFSFSDLIASLGLIILSVPFGAIALASLPFYGLGLLFSKVFKKDSFIQKKIENYKFSLYDSWKFTIFNVKRKYENVKEKSINEIKIIFKSSNINIEPILKKKEKYDKIYEKFKKLIEEK